jgi:hypothetical protein
MLERHDNQKGGAAMQNISEIPKCISKGAGRARCNLKNGATKRPAITADHTNNTSRRIGYELV